MSDYTPTTDEVRRQYWNATAYRRRPSEAFAEFERWLATHEAEIRAEQREADYQIAHIVHVAAECSTDGMLSAWMDSRSRTAEEIARAIRAVPANTGTESTDSERQS